MPHGPWVLHVMFESKDIAYFFNGVERLIYWYPIFSCFEP